VSIARYGSDEMTYVGESFDESDVKVFSDVWNPLLEIVVKEVLQFSGEFNTSWSTTDHDHMKKSLDFIRVLVFKHSGFAAVHDSSSNSLGVIHLFQEQTMFFDSGNAYHGLIRVNCSRADGHTKCCIFSANANDKHIKRNFVLGNITFDITIIVDMDHLSFVVDLGSLSFVECNRPLLVS
jgi:hypothetical protein